MDKSQKKPFRIAKWIMLTFAVLLNSFIIVYSSLDDKTTNSWSRFVSNLFTNAVNEIAPKEVEIIPVTSVEASFNTTAPEYDIKGFQKDEIPLGCEKGIEAKVLPSNATNGSVTYTTEDTDIVALRCYDTKATAIGLKVGTAVIKVTTSDPAIYDTITVKVVDPIAPVYFEASIENNVIPIGDVETIDIVVKKSMFSGSLDLIYHTEYDIYKLNYDSDDHSIATIGKYGVITPVSEGTTTIRVSNDYGDEYSFEVTVVSGTPTPEYENLIMAGEDYTYPSKTICLGIKNGSDFIDSSEFIWESSNIVLATVNQEGVIKGHIKSTIENEVVTIKATNKKTHQVVTKDIIIKNDPPRAMSVCYEIGGKELWNQSRVTTFVGDVIRVTVVYDNSVYDNSILVSVSDESMVTYTNQGRDVTLQFNKEGTVNITLISAVDPSLTSTTKVTVVKAGAIGQNEVEGVHISLRKSIGHALMFAITQVFTFLALYMFLYNKKLNWWMIVIISFACGLLLASVSELIQYFIPLRSGTFVDVLIDMAGVTVGLSITLGILFLVKHIKNKKQKSRVAKD